MPDVLGLLVGLVRPLQQTFYTNGAALQVVGMAIESFSNCAVSARRSNHTVLPSLLLEAIHTYIMHVAHA